MCNHFGGAIQNEKSSVQPDKNNINRLLTPNKIRNGKNLISKKFHKSKCQNIHPNTCDSYRRYHVFKADTNIFCIVAPKLENLILFQLKQVDDVDVA